VPEYRRANIPGSSVFLTLITYKHGLVKCVHDWEYSSFHREVKRGNYDVKWGCQCNGNIFTPVVTSLINLEMGE
jgi:putative transposase